MEMNKHFINKQLHNFNLVMQQRVFTHIKETEWPRKNQLQIFFVCPYSLPGIKTRTFSMLTNEVIPRSENMTTL